MGAWRSFDVSGSSKSSQSGILWAIVEPKFDMSRG